MLREGPYTALKDLTQVLQIWLVLRAGPTRMVRNRSSAMLVDEAFRPCSAWETVPFFGFEALDHALSRSILTEHASAKLRESLLRSLNVRARTQPPEDDQRFVQPIACLLRLAFLGVHQS